MKHKIIYHISFALFVFAAVVACQKSELAGSGPEDEVVVKFSPSVSSAKVMTKGYLINEEGPGKIDFDEWGDFFVSAWDDASTPLNIIPGTAGSYQMVWMMGYEWNTVYEGEDGEWYSREYLWKTGETKTFYAYSNLPTDGASITNTTASSQTLSYEVPDVASDQTDILMGFYSGNGKSGTPANMTGTASIVFSHPLTAVQFRLGTIEGVSSFTVNSISIEGVYSSGTAVMTPGSAAEPDPKDRFLWTPTGIKTVSHTLEYQPEGLGDPVGEAFLLIPQTFSSSSTARIVFNITVDGTKTLNLYQPVVSCEWKAGYTNVYTIGYDIGASYIFTLSSGRTEATQSFNNTTTSSTQSLSLVNKKIDESIEYDVDWLIKSVQVGSGEVEPVNASSFTGKGGLDVSAEDGTISITANERTPLNQGTNDYWRNQDPVRDDNPDWSPADWSASTASSPIDLSRYDFKTEATDKAMTTANCYIIRHAGSYKLPLVYGNGVVGGAINGQSYAPVMAEGGSKSNFLSPFQNHLGNGITSPFIEYNTSCTADAVEIVWQDKADIITIDKIQKENVLVGGNNYNISYIYFTIPQDKICQNNAVIAVKDGSGNTMWSWHIWTTNDPALLSDPISVWNLSDVEYKFFPLNNLGWLEADNYPGREDVRITLVQEESNNEIVITVKQDPVLMPSNGCWYQFGRKDPMCTTDSPAYGTFSFSADPDARISIATAICNPGAFYVRAFGDWCEKYYYNFWTGRFSDEGIIEQGDNLIKTIYDPSPVGYKMPASAAYSAFTYDGENSKYSRGLNVTKFDYGYYFYTRKMSERTSSTPTIYFPAAGCRSNKTGNIAGVGTNGYYWSAVLCSRYEGYRLNFNKETGGIENIHPQGQYARSHGNSVRPVKEQ